jgi:dihydroneopterin aldolase
MSELTSEQMDSVFVRGLEFEGNHGYSAAERRGTRRFRVNLALGVPLGDAAVSDRISEDRKSTRLNSSHNPASRMPSSA